MTAEAAELMAAREEIKRLRATTKRPRCTDRPGTCSANPPPAKCHPAVTRAANPEEELSTDETRISLRVKVPLEDGTAIVEMTGPAVPENGLQAFGDWVLAALEQHVDGAAETARLMIAALRERDWEATTSWLISLTRC